MNIINTSLNFSTGEHRISSTNSITQILQFSKGLLPKIAETFRVKELNTSPDTLTNS